jgi:hypothetical protein
MTRGKRYAFLAFLYGEADARLRELNNAKIAQSEFRYSGGESDRLFPGLERKPEDSREPEQTPEQEPARRAG